MHVSLTPALEEMVRQKVGTGRYNNASEVIREALRLMAEQDEIRQAKIDTLRQALFAGEVSGAAQPFNLRELNRLLDKESGKTGPV